MAINSNGLDCLYFVRDNQYFQIEYEAVDKDQVPYMEKLKIFAQQNGYDTQMSSYRNEKEVPVLRIITNSNLEKTAELGRKIQKEIFNNDENVEYEIVP